MVEATSRSVAFDHTSASFHSISFDSRCPTSPSPRILGLAPRRMSEALDVNEIGLCFFVSTDSPSSSDILPYLEERGEEEKSAELLGRVARALNMDTTTGEQPALHADMWKIINGGSHSATFHVRDRDQGTTLHPANELAKSLMRSKANFEEKVSHYRATLEEGSDEFQVLSSVHDAIRHAYFDAYRQVVYCADAGRIGSAACNRLERKVGEIDRMVLESEGIEISDNLNQVTDKVTDGDSSTVKSDVGAPLSLSSMRSIEKSCRMYRNRLAKELKERMSVTGEWCPGRDEADGRLESALDLYVIQKRVEMEEQMRREEDSKRPLVTHTALLQTYEEFSYRQQQSDSSSCRATGMEGSGFDDIEAFNKFSLETSRIGEDRVGLVNLQLPLTEKQYQYEEGGTTKLKPVVRAAKSASDSVHLELALKDYQIRAFEKFKRDNPAAAERIGEMEAPLRLRDYQAFLDMCVG